MCGHRIKHGLLGLFTEDNESGITAFLLRIELEGCDLRPFSVSSGVGRVMQLADDRYSVVLSCKVCTKFYALFLHFHALVVLSLSRACVPLHRLR